MKNPCDPTCPKRTGGCHAICEAYTEWKVDQEKKKELAKKEIYKNAMVDACRRQYERR